MSQNYPTEHTRPRRVQKFPLVFVGGCPVETTPDELVQAFAAYRIEVMSLPTVKTGRRFAYFPEVQIKNASQKDLAIKMGNILIRGRMAQIRPHNRSQKPKDYNFHRVNGSLMSDPYARDFAGKRMEMDRMRHSMECMQFEQQGGFGYPRRVQAPFAMIDPKMKREYEEKFGDENGYRLREAVHKSPAHKRRQTSPSTTQFDQRRNALKWEEIKLRAKLAHIQEELKRGPSVTQSPTEVGNRHRLDFHLPEPELPKRDGDSHSILVLVKDDQVKAEVGKSEPKPEVIASTEDLGDLEPNDSDEDPLLGLN